VEWVEVVDKVAVVVAVAVLVAVVDVGQAGWAVPLLLAPVATASVPVAGIESRTWQVYPVIGRSAHSAARR
jgi:hypothetical protein